jgi:hypothetical protein
MVNTILFSLSINFTSVSFNWVHINIIHVMLYGISTFQIKDIWQWISRCSYIHLRPVFISKLLHFKQVHCSRREKKPVPLPLLLISISKKEDAIIIGDLVWLNYKHDLLFFPLFVKTVESDNRLTKASTSNKVIKQTNIMPCTAMLIRDILVFSLEIVLRLSI